MSDMPTNTLPEGDEKRAAVQQMFDTIAPRYDLVNRLLTMRLDVSWRKKAQRSLSLARGSTVLDLACGTGDFCRSLDKAGYSPVGIDLSFGMLSASTTDAPLVQGDLLTLPIQDAGVDGAICGFALRNLVSLDSFFSELVRVVRPGGRIALLDVSQPDNAIMRYGHGIYFNKVVPKLGSLLSDRQAYAYLPRSVSYLPEPPVMLRMLSQAGFSNVNREQLSGGISQLLTATR